MSFSHTSNMNLNVNVNNWLSVVKKKTSRLSTRITASLGLISLPRDEDFEHHFDNLKHIEKTIRAFIKDVTNFVDHFENFLNSLQATSESIATFYRDKSNQREIDELRKKNKTVACDHFYKFKRTIERQIISVINNLLLKFKLPVHLANERLVKLIDYDSKTKRLGACRDAQKKEVLHDKQLKAQEAYDKINNQLKHELPIFNQIAVEIFKQCALVLLESRKNLIYSYTNSTANLLQTPMMSEYSVDMLSKMFMSDVMENFHTKHTIKINELCDKVRSSASPMPMLGATNHQLSIDDVDFRQKGKHSGSSTQGSKSVVSQLSNDFESLGVGEGERSSTPLTVSSEGQDLANGKDTRDIHRADDAGDDEGNDHFEKTRGVIANDAKNNDGQSDNEVDDDARSVCTDNHEPNEHSSGEREIGKIYVASWPFIATGPTQLSVAFNQQVKLLKNCDARGNQEWSLVQDRRNRTGYVPSSYIKRKGN